MTGQREAQGTVSGCGQAAWRRLSLCEAERVALSDQVGRIAELGNAWSPSEEALSEVVLAVKAAAREEHAALQRAGIEEARQRGGHLGRPRRVVPPNFDEYAVLVSEGTTSKSAAARALGVSRETFSHWYASWQK